MNTSFLVTAGSVERRPLTSEALAFFSHYIIKSDLGGFENNSYCQTDAGLVFFMDRCVQCVCKKKKNRSLSSVSVF